MNYSSKTRLDVALTEQKLVRSRSTAVTLIKEGKVLVNGKVVLKPSYKVRFDEIINVTEVPPYVSRAGTKLAKALDHFAIDVKDKVAVDIGASTGGFTDVLLQRGIKQVYTVDVGTGQLAPEIRDNPRVMTFEQTDARSAILPEPAEIAVVDVSFISLTHLLESIHRMLTETGIAVLLIKPQFEVGKDNVGKRGIASDVAEHKIAIDRILKLAKKLKFKTHTVIESPILGSTGNTEYLTYLVKQEIVEKNVTKKIATVKKAKKAKNTKSKKTPSQKIKAIKKTKKVIPTKKIKSKKTVSKKTKNRKTITR